MHARVVATSSGALVVTIYNSDCWKQAGGNSDDNNRVAYGLPAAAAADGRTGSRRRRLMAAVGKRNDKTRAVRGREGLLFITFSRELHALRD